MTEFNFAKQKWGDWKKDTETAQKRTTVKMTGVYDPSPGTTAPAVRVGADDHQNYPSLRGSLRHYLDGRVEKVTR
jgi:hypothetical protein